jgi:acid phosphatase (class A)
MNHVVAAALALASVLLVSPAFGQQVEREPRPQGEPRPQPYLASNPVDFRNVLAPPPRADSLWDTDDRRAVDELQKVDDNRWESAGLDAAFVYPRFEEAFGKPIDRKTSPALIHLLNRALRDVGATTFKAKEYFQRPRPYQRVQLQRVCGEERAPPPEPRPSGGSSYPSGHSAYGWAVAMVLARVAPERAEALLARAAEYAESRIICGMHFPTDVSAGQTLAAAVIAHLDASAEFQADVARARAEVFRTAAR